MMDKSSSKIIVIQQESSSFTIRKCEPGELEMSDAMKAFLDAPQEPAPSSGPLLLVHYLPLGITTSEGNLYSIGFEILGESNDNDGDPLDKSR